MTPDHQFTRPSTAALCLLLSGRLLPALGVGQCAHAQLKYRSDYGSIT